jgi:hypothetical protein
MNMTQVARTESLELSIERLDQISGGGASSKQLFEINDYSFDVAQVLNIGSQSSGAGAGKVTFNPF